MNNVIEDKTYHESEEISAFIPYRGIYCKYIKRIIDFSFALMFMLVLFPLYILIAIAIIVETGFPVFYKAERGGYKGKAFKIYKFRSMVRDADKIGGSTTALNDSRITKVGRFLRKTKLDETAQLINIIKGEMSFIGPRPELLKYTNNYKGVEKNILNVRPGITDYSSIEYINLDEIVGSDNADEMYEKYVLHNKNQLRIKYVADISFKTDVKLFMLTILAVIKKVLPFVAKKQPIKVRDAKWNI